MYKHHNGCAIYDDGQCTCDALPYPRDTARSAVATPAYLQIDWLERRVKELEAEADRLRNRVIELSEADERRKLDAEAEVERLESLFQQTHGVHHSWVDARHKVAERQREACELYLRNKAEEIMADGGERELAISLHRAADRVENTPLVTEGDK